jgi:hypothetical protein
MRCIKIGANNMPLQPSLPLYILQFHIISTTNATAVRTCEAGTILES